MFKCCTMASLQVEKVDKELLSKTKENTEYMTLKGNKYMAKIVYIYDGDTMHVVFKEFDQYYRWNCRIMGVDTPELRTKNEKEKKAGYAIRDKLREMLMDKILKVKCDEFDKYGRVLGTIYVNQTDEKSVNDLMIENGYAYEYHGGTKKN